MAAAIAEAQSAKSADRSAVATFRQMVPQLGGNYKGSHGKVAVVGGCLEFTGAPFFAAMSALRAGADMAYVICTPSAATAIKSYSPELMVLPYLPEDPDAGEGAAPDAAAVAKALARIQPWLGRASCLVVGPGLGSDPAVCATAAELMGEARRLGLPLVVDGSALTHIVAKTPEVVLGNPRCLLTPNVAELGRIAAAVGRPLPGRMSDAWLAHAPEVAEAFQGPVLLAKGEADLLCVPSSSATTPAPSAPKGEAEAGALGRQPLLRCSEPGALRRCGGQGDVLAGTAGAFLCWAAKSEGGLDASSIATAAYVACKVMRSAAREAYSERERSMLAGDIIPHLHAAFKRVLGCWP
ncbi:hypothetical protein HYH03_011199 [Edaphochlamys debaryana]|uniref:ATP-dependent (S)-NAD(P)H-hydrate dehydratase n=1 Tax=Edaphochlamys debaryana TaxID=47281 RepID=A0A835Y3I6_9CHLO|nr:hypothetical protein HYH03_011199 [Edaphochlamys debaryana]|eukprot:KAG2490399.1 hypothetical protein HYH03_011199 [Edaphochlamys debaryana]